MLGKNVSSEIDTPDSIYELVARQARQRPEHSALIGLNGLPLNYRGLLAQINRTVASLNSRGIGLQDCVALVLPNGPYLAAAFLAIAAGATCAPLNPGYRREEFEFYLKDLQAKALVVSEGSGSPAVEAAISVGVNVIELKPRGPEAPVGTFFLREPDGSRGPGVGPARNAFAESCDTAMVLHTSGTTSRPKIVPLSGANICASAHHIARTLKLVPQDRCLNIMPLFHIHGLMGAVVASVVAGAEVVCTSGFDAMRFFSWVRDFKPTWYTAVPTMHQAILGRALRNRDIVDKSQLRFIRSSSASLPPQVMEELESLFGVPVIESYGMTEAAHQMASNPLPPGIRKPGSVGIAAGPEIAVMDEKGNLLDDGIVGEVVIRGPNVTVGYESNSTANAEAFTDGWFRTGDQGFLDEDKYLTITGRLKEIINRGGEKISPREVDEVLLDHPSVQQAVTFSVPHSKLGEEVAAAVVFHEGLEVEARDLRSFLSQRLADFKVPRKIVFLDEIPKGSTGKLQRIGLAEKLGLT
jgi:acyl-CoA synthetase (AMP-forming)/AMP-acid ligase II